MGRKIICEACETIFKEEIIKDATVCPVCGASLADEEETQPTDSEDEIQSDVNDPDKTIMYFDEIATSYKEHPEYNGVCAYCGNCGETNSLKFPLFDELVDKDHVTLKEGTIVKCRGCGKEHNGRKIMYKRKDNYAPPLPRCPLCNSAMLKKIKTSSKFWAAASLGAFAIPYTSKTYECQNCGFKF